MWPFKRKQTTTIEAPAMPPELNDYYQAEKRQHTIVTWLLGAATLLVTIAIAFGLFLGGRYIFRKLHKQSANPPIATQSAPATSGTPATPSQTGSPNGTVATTNTSSSTTTTGTTAGTTTPTSTTTPQTSSATTNLPNTGPTETFAVFMLATLVGTAIHAAARKHE